MGFVHQRELTKGDIKSSLGWILEFDILVVGLGLFHPELYSKAPIAGSHAYTLTSLVFLDDLTSLTVDRYHTQELAHIISAFNAIIGTNFAAAKFRALSTIQVYDWNSHPGRTIR